MKIEIRVAATIHRHPSLGRQDASDLCTVCTRTLIHNMVIGVTEGFQKGLDVVGVGYRAQLQGKNLVLTIGYSHPVEMVRPGRHCV